MAEPPEGDAPPPPAAARVQLRTGPPLTLRVGLALLLALAAAVAAAEVALTVTYGGLERPADLAVVAAFPLVGLECFAVGVWTWDRRPGNLTGALLCLLGLSALLAAAGNTGPALGVVGIVAAELPIGVLLHLLLAFPGGRLTATRDRFLCACGYVATVLPAIVTLVVADTGPGPSTGPHAGFTLAADRVQSALAALVLAGSVVSMLRRAGGARVATGERRALSVVYAYGVFVLLFMPLSAHLLPALGLSDVERFAAQLAALALVPVAFTVAMFRGGLARTGEIQELAAWLAASEAHRPPLRDALARVLGDDSLELLFHDTRTGALLDPHGRAVQPPGDPADPDGDGPGDRRAVAIPGRDGPVAVVVHDRRLIPDRALVESAGRMVGLALERERLTAELLAGREVIRRSRARIVEVGDEERRRVAQDLHDLLQGRLVLAAVHAGRLASLSAGDRDGTREAIGEAAVALRRELDAAVTELRRQVHEVMPAPLVERGLLAAIEDLADRVPLRTRLELPPGPLSLPTTVATTAYFIAAEAVANAVKHARARELVLSVRWGGGILRIEVADDGVGGAAAPGSGIRGMSARAEALDGRLQVDSPPGAGTRIVARLPCGS